MGIHRCQFSQAKQNTTPAGRELAAENAQMGTHRCQFRF